MNSTLALAFLVWFGLSVMVWGLLKRATTSQLFLNSWRLGWLIVMAFVFGILLTLLLLYYQP